MRYKNRIVLTNTRGVSHTLRSFMNVSISDSENNPLKTCTVEAGFFDNKEIIKSFSIGTKIEVYTKLESEQRERRIFVGVINTVPRNLDGNLKKYNFDATCLLGKTQRILINELFEGESLSTIVNYLIDNYTNFFKAKEIRVPNDTIVSLEFRDEFLYDALIKIAEATDGFFEADDERFVFRDKKSSVSDREVKRGMFEKGSASFSENSDQMVNFIRGYGAKELTPTYREETLNTNGTIKQFHTKYKPSNVEVYVDDVKQTVGTMYLHESGYQCYVDYQQSLIEFEAAPKKGKKVRIKYKYYQRIVVEEADQASIEEFGMFAEAVQLKHISDRQLLRDNLRVRIARYRQPIKTGSLKPFYDLWKTGELIYINLPDLGIEEYLALTGKDTRISPGVLTFDYKFEEPPDLTDILKNHLERIRSLEKMEDEPEFIDKYRSVDEKIELKEHLKYEVIDWERTFRIGISVIGDVI